jgi:hypothetical protein
VDESARRLGASVEQATSDAERAYARFPARVPTAYRPGSLPG